MHFMTFGGVTAISSQTKMGWIIIGCQNGDNLIPPPVGIFEMIPYEFYDIELKSNYIYFYDLSTLQASHYERLNQLLPSSAQLIATST